MTRQYPHRLDGNLLVIDTCCRFVRNCRELGRALISSRESIIRALHMQETISAGRRRGGGPGSQWPRYSDIQVLLIWQRPPLASWRSCCRSTSTRTPRGHRGRYHSKAGGAEPGTAGACAARTYLTIHAVDGSIPVHRRTRPTPVHRPGFGARAHLRHQFRYLPATTSGCDGAAGVVGRHDAVDRRRVGHRLEPGRVRPFQGDGPPIRSGRMGRIRLLRFAFALLLGPAPASERHPGWTPPSGLR